MTFDPSGASGPRDTGLASIQQNGVRILGLMQQTLGRLFPQVTGTATSATGGAATLPANPQGFLKVVNTDGTTVLVPFYNP